MCNTFFPGSTTSQLFPYITRLYPCSNESLNVHNRDYMIAEEKRSRAEHVCVAWSYRREAVSTLPWELCFWVAVSLPRRGKGNHLSIRISLLLCCHKWRECKKKHLFWNWGWILLISMCEWLLSGSVWQASYLKTLYVFESPELIENVKLIHKPVSLQPRGLVNKGNWCYINAVSFHSACVFPSGFSWHLCFWTSLAVLPDSKHSDATGPHRMSTYVSPDEVHPSAERNAEAMHLHTHDR